MPLDIERTYVNLIFRASRKYAAWDPEKPIQVGDYGRISKGQPPRWPLTLGNKNNGTFIKEGNIYNEGIAETYDIPAAEEYGVESEDGITWITSTNAQKAGIDVEASGHAPGAMTTVRAKAAFSFKEGRGALIAMENDTLSSIPSPGKLRRLLDEPTLKGFVIVSEVHQTSSYIRYLSTKDSETVAVGLSVEAPAANVASVGVNAKWVHSAMSGNFKTKTSKEGNRVYYPLYKLVALEDNGPVVGLRGDMEGKDPELPDALPPWSLEASQKSQGMSPLKKRWFSCLDKGYFLP